LRLRKKGRQAIAKREEEISISLKRRSPSRLTDGPAPLVQKNQSTSTLWRRKGKNIWGFMNQIKNSKASTSSERIRHP